MVRRRAQLLSLALLGICMHVLNSRTQLAAASLNMTDIALELADLVEDPHSKGSNRTAMDCMDLKQLADVLPLAAWHGTDVTGKAQKAVMLTSCDVTCMRELFQPFLYSLEHSRSGDISRHLVVAANSVPAYILCEHLRYKHNHYCVLDLFCGFHEPGNKDWAHSRGDISFGTRTYTFALVQKLRWAEAILKMGYSTMWLDMDVFVFSNPIEFLMQWPDADFLMSQETCDQPTRFESDVRLWTDNIPKEQRWFPNQNCGVWLAHPTPVAIGFMAFWIVDLVKRLYHDGRVGEFDQAVFNAILLDDYYVTYKLRVDEEGKVQLGEQVDRPKGLRLLSVHQSHFMNFCTGSLCGCNRDWQATEFHITEDGTVQCHEPQAWVDGLITMHFNCLGPKPMKRDNMIRLQKFRGLPPSSPSAGSDASG